MTKIIRQFTVGMLLFLTTANSIECRETDHGSASLSYRHFYKNSVVEILHDFDPTQINSIVVGCDMLGHERHFFQESEELFPRLLFEQNNDAHTIVYKFYHKLIDDEKEFTDKKEAVFYVNDIESAEIIKFAPCYIPYRPEIEVDPRTTLYINLTTDSYQHRGEGFIHLKGNFESMTSMPFLSIIKKIIVEYLVPRGKKNYVRIINNAYTILAVGGSLYIEQAVDNPVGGNYMGDLEVLIPRELKNKLVYRECYAEIKGKRCPSAKGSELYFTKFTKIAD